MTKIYLIITYAFKLLVSRLRQQLSNTGENYLGNGAVEIQTNQRGDVGCGNRSGVSGNDCGACIAWLRHHQHLHHSHTIIPPSSSSWSSTPICSRKTAADATTTSFCRLFLGVMPAGSPWRLPKENLWNYTGARFFSGRVSFLSRNYCTTPKENKNKGSE